MLDWVTVCCPYCGEHFDTAVDYAGNDQQYQQYVEDCQVCCNPILFHLRMDADNQLLTVETEQENP